MILLLGYLKPANDAERGTHWWGARAGNRPGLPGTPIKTLR